MMNAPRSENEPVSDNAPATHGDRSSAGATEPIAVHQVAMAELEQLMVLTFWALGNIAAGSLLFVLLAAMPMTGLPRPWTIDAANIIGMHLLIWGWINVALAVAGIRGCLGRLRRPPSATSERDRLAVLLRILAWSLRFDRLTLVAAAVLMVAAAIPWADPSASVGLVSHAIAIVPQAGFLLWFDLRLKGAVRRWQTWVQTPTPASQ